MKNKLNSKSKDYFRSFYKGNKLLFVAVLLITPFLTAAYLSITVLIGQLLDIITDGTEAQLIRVALLILVAIAAYFILGVLEGRLKARFIQKAVRNYRNFCYGKLTAKAISAFSKENTGRYLSVLTNDVTAIEDKYLANIFDVVFDLFLFVATLCLLMYYSPVLTVVSIVLCILPLVVAISMGGKMAENEKAVSEQNEKFVGSLQDLLRDFSVIKSFKAESRVKTVFSNENEQLEDKKFSRRWYQRLMYVSASAASLFMQLGLFAVATFLALRGNITVGTVLIFANGANYLVSPIRELPQLFAGIKSARALVVKMSEVAEENVRNDGLKIEADLKNEIALKDVSFGYGEDTILNGISLNLRKGGRYAIVGMSGSGKSTLLNLLMGANSNYSGSITIDGTELRDINADSLYDVMSLIGQDVFCFNDTIKNNITMFGDFPEKDAKTAAERAGLDKLISEKGYDYICGENGNGLSGGERQRISIARCLLKGTPVLLVDEATAALDAETAKSVNESILNLDDVTSVTVTHRLEESILKLYDEIFVLREGRIEEQGDFASLMQENGLFYSLYTLSNT